MNRALLISLLLSFYSVDTYAQLDSVVHKYFGAIGGMDAWDTIKSSKEEGKVWQNLDLYGLPPGKMTTLEGVDPTVHKSVKKEPLFEYTALWTNGKRSSEFYYNDRRNGFVTIGMFFELPFGRQWGNIDLAKDILHLYNERKLSFLREEIVEGKAYAVLRKAGTGDEHDQKFHFSKETFLLELITSDKRPNVVRRFFDYRDVSGVKVPFRKESRQDGILFFREELVSLEFNPLINDSIFYYREPAEPPVEHRSVGKVLGDDNLDFKKFIETNFKNKRVLIDLWASWCAPCKGEFQYYDSAYYQFMNEHQVELLFISIDKETQRNAWERDINKYSLNGYHVLAGNKLQKSIRKLIYKNGEVVIPRYVVVNEKGEILSGDFKRPSDSQFKRELELLFPE